MCGREEEYLREETNGDAARGSTRLKPVVDWIGVPGERRSASCRRD